MKRSDPIYGVGYDYPPMIINPYSFATGGGGFDPSDLSPSAWFSDTGSDPGEWSDISGNGFHLTQATAGSQPAILSGDKNGLQTRDFDNDFLFRAANIAGTDYSVAMVYYFDATVGGTNQLFRNGMTSGGSRLERFGPGYTFVHNNVAVVGTTSGLATGWYVLTITRRAGSPNAVSLWHNTTQNINNATTNYNAPSGNFQLGTTTSFKGKIAEMLVFNYELDSTERENLRDWLNDKWAVY